MNKATKISLKSFLVIAEIFLISFIVLTIVFFLMSIMPGSNSITSGLDPEHKAIIEHKYGYDKSVGFRYLLYIKNIFHGDFGISTSILPNNEISVFIWKRIGTSMSIGIVSLVISYAIGFPLGLYVGQRQGKPVDTVASIFTAIFISIPSIVFSLVLLIIGRSIGIPYIFDKSNLSTYTLPLLAIVITGTAAVMKFTRLQVVNEMNTQYAKLAKVKGVSRRRFIWVHAIKPASFLVVSGLPSAFLGTIFGSMFIEVIFQIPGTGAMLFTAISAKDINVIMFVVILLTFITVVSFRLRDVIYVMLDPRMRGA